MSDGKELAGRDSEEQLVAPSAGGAAPAAGMLGVVQVRQIAFHAHQRLAFLPVSPMHELS